MKTFFLSRLRSRVGDLWWYSLLFFVVQRFVDVINMVVGLWLVPKYVPMNELGAVLPLMNAVSFVGLPLAVVSVPFMKFIAVFAEKGEYGKAKALMRDAFAGTVVFSGVAVMLAWKVLPLFFDRFRIPAGSLAMLIVGGTILSSAASLLGNAVSALKMFSAMIWFGAVAAPMRLLTMLLLMPFRALSGYLAGQSASPAVTFLCSLWAVGKWWKRTGDAQPYWKEYGGEILRYTCPILLMTAVSSVSSMFDSLVIRHRLSDFESAGYYIVTRFSDIALYMGAAFSAFLFPMLAGGDGISREVKKYLRQSAAGTILAGLAVALLLMSTGSSLLSLRPDWAPYASLSVEMVVLSLTGALAMTISCISNVFIARSSFGFLWWYLPVMLGKSLFLYGITGYRYLERFLPESLFRAIELLDPCRLSFVVYISFAVQAFTCLAFFMSVRGFGEKE